jgi:hypothetical protein
MFLHVPLTLYSIAANCYAAYYWTITSQTWILSGEVTLNC